MDWLSLASEWGTTSKLRSLSRVMGSKLLSLLSIIRLAGLAVAMLAMAGFAFIAEEVLRHQTQRFDLGILLALKSLHTPSLDRMMIGFTFLGESHLLLALSLGLGLLLLGRNHRSEATTLAIATAGAMGLNALLKQLFARVRPALWERVVEVRFYSFPSGHAMISLVLYGLLGYFLLVRFPRWRWLIISLTIFLVVTIGFSRLYLGVHWPTDVIAGYTAGLVWLMTCILSLEIWKELRSVVNAPEEKFLSSD